MHADGYLAEKEKMFISQLGNKMGLKDEEINSLIQNFKENDYKTPVSISRRYAELYELIGMVVIDGRIHENEVKMLKTLAQKLGFNPEIIDKTLESLNDFINKGYHTNNLGNDYSTFFKTV